MKRVLTDRVITALKAASDGKPYDVTDATTPGLAVRVMPSRNEQKPAKTFILVARYAGPRSNPTRRSLGRYREITLDDAIEKARRWLNLISQGKDPATEEKRIADEAERSRANSLGHVIEDYIALEAIGPDPKKPRQRRGHHVARELRRVIVPLWGTKPIADISRSDVQKLIEDIRDWGVVNVVPGLTRGYARPTPTYARNLLSYLKTVFSWAIERGAYGVAASPAAHVRAERLLGPRRQRDRILSPDELFAFWRAVTRMPYPAGPAYQLLALAGLRLNEVLRAERREFDLRNKLWVIPEGRMKGRNGRARAHAVPLTDRMIEIIEALPATQYLFSKGRRPYDLDDKDKADLDRRMLRTLRAMARQRGEDPNAVELAPWVNHDLRRNIRSTLGAARTDGKARFHPDTAEAILAHSRAGIRAVYDVHDALPEKAEALAYWDAHLMALMTPRVVPLRRVG